MVIINIITSISKRKKAIDFDFIYVYVYLKILERDAYCLTENVECSDWRS